MKSRNTSPRLFLTNLLLISFLVSIITGTKVMAATENNPWLWYYNPQSSSCTDLTINNDGSYTPAFPGTFPSSYVLLTGTDYDPYTGQSFDYAKACPPPNNASYTQAGSKASFAAYTDKDVYAYGETPILTLSAISGDQGYRIGGWISGGVINDLTNAIFCASWYNPFGRSCHGPPHVSIDATLDRGYDTQIQSSVGVPKVFNGDWVDTGDFKFMTNRGNWATTPVTDFSVYSMKDANGYPVIIHPTGISFSINSSGQAYGVKSFLPAKTLTLQNVGSFSIGKLAPGNHTVTLHGCYDNNGDQCADTAIAFTVLSATPPAVNLFFSFLIPDFKYLFKKVF